MVICDPLIALEAIYRAESRRLFATLVRTLGDFDVAEDALQEAVRAATIQWPERGVPENPIGWLFQTARNQGISYLRKNRRTVSLTDLELGLTPEPTEIGDELLRLVFTCCHPAISADAQVALTLREVCELTTEEIASAFLVPQPTIAQRIVRAKAKIRSAAIPFEIPGKEEWPERIGPTLKTIYLVFNEGYTSSSGRSLVRQELISLAIHLGRQMLDLMPEPETMGLLALMLVQNARSQTRSSAEGEIILFKDQDRSLWDRSAITEADELVSTSFRTGRYGSYTLQAAIALMYVDAESYAETDWNEIVGLYNLLAGLEPSPIVELNRAVAVAMRDGPQGGIQLINQLIDSGGLAAYHRAYAARGELHFLDGNACDARADFQLAHGLARQEAEKIFLQKRLTEIS